MLFRSKDSSIKIYHKVNNASAWTEASSVVDEINNLVSIKESLPSANSIQIKVELNCAGGANKNNTPEVELAEFNFD